MLSLSSTIWLLLSPIITVIVAIVIKEALFLITYIRKYKTQKMPLKFIPLIGWFDLLIPKSKDKNAFDHFYDVTNNEFKGKKIVVMNQHSNPNPLVLLFDSKLIGDFFVKEVENFKRELPTEMPLPQGFIMEHGQGALKKKSDF